MKSERILDILGNVDEKYIQEAAPNAKARQTTPAWIKWAAIAACFCIVLFGAFALSGLLNKRGIDMPQSGGTPGKNPVQPGKQNVLFVNEIGSSANTDMDVQFSAYNQISSAERIKVEAQFKRVVGVGYDDFIARIPDALTISSFYSVDTPINASEKEYAPHDYVFECSAQTGGKVRLAVSSLGPNCRDLFIMTENPTKSQIKGIDIMIYGWDGMYWVDFSCDGRFYDIETSDFALEELESLLASLIG